MSTLSELFKKNSILYGGPNQSYGIKNYTLPNNAGSYSAMSGTNPAPAVVPSPPPQPPVKNLAYYQNLARFGKTPAEKAEGQAYIDKTVVAPPVKKVFTGGGGGNINEGPGPVALDYSKYTNPATGQPYSPQEYADMMAKRAGGGGISNYAGDAITNPNQTVEQLTGSAYDLNNTRNDIATGNTDPYKVASQSGIQYTPAQLKAIESAYAGVYDPALKDVFAKIDAKEKEVADEKSWAQELKKLAVQHQYSMEEKALTSGGGLMGGVYTPGVNPSVDAFAELIWNGKATMATVPKEYKMAVATAMQSYGNQIDGKPTTTEIGKQKLTAAKKALDMFDKGEGTGTVGKSRMFGGGIALPGGKNADFYSLVDQLRAIAQLDASKFLKGQGQVSDAERAILASAATSLKYNQSETLFRKTLVDMINVLEGNVPPTSETTTGEVMTSPDGTEEVSLSDLTPAQIKEAQDAGWK